MRYILKDNGCVEKQQDFSQPTAVPAVAAAAMAALKQASYRDVFLSAMHSLRSSTQVPVPVPVLVEVEVGVDVEVDTSGGRNGGWAGGAVLIFAVDDGAKLNGLPEGLPYGRRDAMDTVASEVPVAMLAFAPLAATGVPSGSSMVNEEAAPAYA